MAKPTKRRAGAARRTGTGAKRAAKGGRTTPKVVESGRYTAPIPKSEKVSPLWVPALMFTCLGLGMIIIITNYVDVLPGGTSNWYLLIGLGLITVGFLTATQYR
jgi:hypothetical protein